MKNKTKNNIKQIIIVLVVSRKKKKKPKHHNSILFEWDYFIFNFLKNTFDTFAWYWINDLKTIKSYTSKKKKKKH